MTNAVTGLMAIILMLIHASWAVCTYFNGREKELQKV